MSRLVTLFCRQEVCDNDLCDKINWTYHHRNPKYTAASYHSAGVGAEAIISVQPEGKECADEVFYRAAAPMNNSRYIRIRERRLD